MKILLLNGSPRNGNTKFAIETIGSSITNNMKDADTEIITVADKDINPCKGCDYCHSNDGTCVFKDDMTDITERVIEADTIIFGSPVYWWGITAQLKTLIDRLYMMSGKSGKAGKNIGTVIIGQDELSGPQYRLINEQFDCICKHLGWNVIFHKSISADKADDVRNNPKEVNELERLWERL